MSQNLAPSESKRLAAIRFVATVVGALWGAMLSQLLPPDAWAIGLGILIAMLTCQVLHSSEGAKVAGFICGIVVLDHSVTPWVSASHRLIETGLGVAVALLVSYVPKLIKLEEPAKPADAAVLDARIRL